MEIISLQGKTNFFEKRVGEYQKSGEWIAVFMHSQSNSFGHSLICPSATEYIRWEPVILFPLHQSICRALADFSCCFLPRHRCVEQLAGRCEQIQPGR
eukprot:819410-Pelagomonas_calceolata.AAC.1